MKIRFRGLPSQAAVGLSASGLLILSSLAFFGCGGGGTSSSSGDQTEKAIKAGGVVHYALEAQPLTLDPSRLTQNAAAEVFFQFGEAPYSFGKHGEPVPNMVSGFKKSADGLTWEFTLKPGIKFSNGKPVTAKDVAFSVETARTGPYAGSNYAQIASAKAVSSKVFAITTKRPYPALPSKLTGSGPAVIPYNYGGETEEEFGQHPIGTGPFEIASKNLGPIIRLVPNKNFWKPEKPKLEEIVFSTVTNETSRLAQLRAGDIDIAPATPIGAKTGIPDGSGLKIEETPLVVVDYLLLNQNVPLFHDKRVREAINLAVDRKGIVSAATDERGVLGASFLPPAMRDSIDVKPPTRDVAKAKELVAEAVKSGVDPSFTINSYDNETYAGYATQVIQQDLEEIGLKVKLQPLDEATFSEFLPSGEYEAAVANYSVPSTPVEMSAFYAGYYAPGNGADAAAQEKLVEEAGDKSEADAGPLFEQLQEEIIAEESLLVLNYQPFIYGVSEKVSGIETTTLGMLLQNAGLTE